ncbi:MAG: methylated-DNA--[protein]-cysteine S-methyltransferase [Bacillota bacterium]
MSAAATACQVFCSTADSPIGAIWVASTAAGLIRVGHPSETEDERLSWVFRAFPGAAVVHGERENAEVHKELDEYFAGVRKAFDSRIRLVTTAFGHRVLEETSRIPYGKTVSYGQIAAAIGAPSATRAVGRALAANPLPIIIPCHRVVGRDGSLVGFGGGLRLKEWLLSHERRVAGV